jgi:hypothetical protein
MNRLKPKAIEIASPYRAPLWTRAHGLRQALAALGNAALIAAIVGIIIGSLAWGMTFAYRLGESTKAALDNPPAAAAPQTHDRGDVA